MEVTVAKQQGSGREAVAERSWRQTPDCRNTNWQRGRKWATSVRGNAKSETHQDTSGRARRHGRKVEALTRGDLRRENAGEVSRGRSSDEACRKAGGAKGRRNQQRSSMERRAPGQHCPDVRSRRCEEHSPLREPNPPQRCSRRKREGARNSRRHA